MANEPAQGLIFHSAGELEGRFQIFNVWESRRENCDRFRADRRRQRWSSLWARSVSPRFLMPKPSTSTYTTTSFRSRITSDAGFFKGLAGAICALMGPRQTSRARTLRSHRPRAAENAPEPR